MLRKCKYENTYDFKTTTPSAPRRMGNPALTDDVIHRKESLWEWESECSATSTGEEAEKRNIRFPTRLRNNFLITITNMNSIMFHKEV
jgi:hypothetical protein